MTGVLVVVGYALLIAGMVWGNPGARMADEYVRWRARRAVERPEEQT